MEESNKSEHLSESKRQLLERLLKEKQLSSSSFQRIPPRSPNSPVPMTYAQQRLWFMSQLEELGASYNVPLAYQIRGVLDVEALRNSFERLAQRHEILRTHFEVLDGQPLQIIEPKARLIFLYLDVRKTPEMFRSKQVERIVVKETNTPFDLKSGPLWRVKVIHLQDEEFVLALNFHHTIFDEWSQGVLFREIAALYKAETQGTSPELEGDGLQYGDYAIWQMEYLKSPEVNSQLEYWKGKLAGAEIVELPLDFARPAMRSYRGGTVRSMVSDDIAEKLRRFSQGEQVTLFSTLLAAFFVLLYRYTGQADLVVGTPVANRNHAQLENMIGLFLNTLVMRVDFSGSPDFYEVVRRVNQTVLEGLANQDLPFEQLVDELKPERSLSQHPLFQIAFAYHPRAVSDLSLDGLQVSRYRINYEWAKFDLTLFISELDDGLHLSLEYSRDLFRHETIERMMAHLVNLLGELVKYSQIPVSRLDFLSPEERRVILKNWNDTHREFRGDTSVYRIVEEQAARQPEATALVYGDTHFSYAELNAQANRLARYLRRKGVRVGQLVAVSVARNVSMVISWLAILKAGGAYLPIDPSYPSERVATMLQDSGAKLVLASGERLKGIPSGVEVIDLEAVWDDISIEEDTNLDVEVSGQALAYVMYTSGSTGQPKGIGIPHRAITRLVINTDYKQIGAGERVAQASNASFDAATFEVWGALMNGGVLVGMQMFDLLDVERLSRRIQSRDIQVLFITTALFNQIAALQSNAFQELDTLLFGGEAVTPEWVRKVIEGGRPERILHVYGPTESTTFTTWHEVKAVPEGAVTIPIGRAIANTRVYVLDEWLQPVPVGVAGELYIGGDGLAQGYYGRVRETAEKFLPDPYTDIPGARMYATGDIVRWNAEGAIEFIGRRDTQVKLRGYRIELGEIETSIKSFRGVRQVVVMMREDRPGDKRLVAYIVSDGENDEEALHEHLKMSLPEYMLPSAYVFLDALPLTPNGKIDRQALPAPREKKKEAAHKAPRDDIERDLLEIWKQVLDVPEIGVDDNFFDLGGNSLLGMQLFSWIEERYQRQLPMSTLFQYPTIAGLASRLKSATLQQSITPIVKIQPQGTRPIFFCVHNFGGEMLNFAPLSKFLGDDQPFFGFQARGIDGKQEPHTTIEEMARAYIQAMRTVQPHGPYYLGGYCFGGIVAYEMACQLQEVGEPVALLAIIDAIAPLREARQKPKLTFKRLWAYITNLPVWLSDFMTLNSREMLVVIKRRFTILRKSLKSLFGKPAERLTPREVLGVDISHVPDFRARLMDTHMRAILNYQPQIYAGELTVFRVRRMPLFKLYDHDVGWGQIVSGEVRVRIVPGAHHNILQMGHARELARELRAAMDEAIQNTSPQKPS